MIDRTTKLRWRRRLRQRQRQIEDLGTNAEKQLEEHFFKRLGRLVDVRRFVFGWVALLVVIATGLVLQAAALGQYYQTVQPAAGGTYTEGVLGVFTNANPIYASGPVDSSVARLVFSGLMKYDQNNQLVGDIATDIQVDERGTTYTVKLRSDVRWHDGYRLTADDVVFTYKTIQNPDAKSPLFSGWKDIKVSSSDASTVVFALPHALTSFPTSLTNGILPQHILKDVPVSQLRSSNFNATKPIGSGPFAWETVEVSGDTPETREEKVGLIANKAYYGGEPKINHFVVRAFHNDESMTKAFNAGQLNAAAGFDVVSDTLNKDKIQEVYSVPVTGEVMVFLKNTNEILQDKTVRQALVKATNTAEVIKGLGYPVIPADEPLLRSSVGYDKRFAQFAPNVIEANDLLEKAGWIRGKDGVRVKGKQRLSFRLYAESSSQYATVTHVLQKQWRAVGAEALVTQQTDVDLQTTVAFHNYDALVYGIALGTDPDVYAYWHSTQADINSPNRLNFSEYKSDVADRALEAGRTRADPGLRAIKYQPFLQAWQTDAPAIALFQPRFLYITHEKVYGFNPTTINYAADRFSNVHNWMIHTVATDN